jgi:hypothetical protein
MKKSLYIFIVLLLGINFWGLIILESVFNNVTNMFFAVIWAAMGFYWFRTSRTNQKNNVFIKYNKYFFWVVVGFGLSVFSANMFWNQGWATGIIVNRGLIWYIYIPVLLYIQPTGEELMKGIFYYSLVYAMIWIVQALTPFPIYSGLASSIEIGRGTFELSETDFGQLLPGYPVILFLLYYRVQKMKENPNIRNMSFAFALMIFFFLLQNRGALFFAVIVFGYALLRIRSPYKSFLIPLFLLLVAIAYFYSAEYWNAQIKETIDQLNDPYTPRWRSFNLFLFGYAPHWICNIIGNGFLSANVPAGKFIQDLMDQGYYQYDNGMIGFWSQYGIIPLLVLYTVIFRILFRRASPFYLKAMAAHILFIPIAWNFGSADIFIFVALIYLYAYYFELQKAPDVTKFNEYRPYRASFALK